MTRFDLYIITTQGGEDIMPNWFTRYHIGELEDEKPRKKKKKKKLTKEEKAKKKAEKEELRKEKVEKKADKIAKKNRKEVEDILVDFRVAESLSDYEKDFYKKVGQIQEGQNYLEAFNDTVIHDLGLILKATFKDKSGRYISSNHSKAQVILDELGPLGFKDVGLGTNIIVLRHKKYPGVVFKIALDSHGIDDNINDEWLSRKHPDMYARFICRHPSGLVSVQEAYACIKDKDRMQDFIGQAYDMITRLERNYVIVDLSPVNFKNFAVRRDGRLIIIDGSDLIPIPKGADLLRCKRIIGMKNNKPKICGARLHYTADYNRLECPVCDNIYMPIEMKPKVEFTEEERMTLVNTGLTRKELKELSRYTDELIVASGFKCPDRDKKKEKDKKSSKDDKPKKAHLDLPEALINDPERKETVMKQVDELTKQFGLYNPFASSDDDSDKEDNDDDFDDEELPEGEPPEENFEYPAIDDLGNDGLLDGERKNSRTDASDRQTQEDDDQANDTFDDRDEEEDEQEGPEIVEVADVPEVIDMTEGNEAPSVAQSSTLVGEGDKVEVQVYESETPASLDVEFSDDPCAINIAISGDIVEAFSENGPSVFISLEDIDPDEWIEIIPPATFGKLIKQLVDKRNQMLHRFHPTELGDNDSTQS